MSINYKLDEEGYVLIKPHETFSHSDQLPISKKFKQIPKIVLQNLLDKKDNKTLNKLKSVISILNSEYNNLVKDLTNGHYILNTSWFRGLKIYPSDANRWIKYLTTRQGIEKWDFDDTKIVSRFEDIPFGYAIETGCGKIIEKEARDINKDREKIKGSTHSTNILIVDEMGHLKIV
jgi:hypothetical protein